MALSPDPLGTLRALPCGQRVFGVFSDADDVWVVGGAVRDLLLGRTPAEIDIVTARTAGDVAAQLGDVVEEHERFGTVKARDGGCVFDVAQTRTESYASPGALPEVQLGATLEADLKRRDFTINAIALSCSGDVIECPRSRADLEAGVLRVLHDESFIDDPTRLWRLVRYSVRLGFKVDPHTSALATAAIADGVLDTVSRERLGAEPRLALNEPDPLATLHAAQHLGLTPNLNLDPALIGVALEILPRGGRPDLLILGGALADDDGWVSDLGFTAGELSILRKCAGASGVPSGPASAIAAQLADLPDEAVALAGARGDRDAAERWLLELRNVALEIDGDDLIAAGVARGPEVGARLQRTLEKKLDGKISGREQELAEALS